MLISRCFRRAASTGAARREASTVAVCGAGFAGCVTARLLADRGVEVTLFDGGRGAGGRMSSRKIGNSSFDHGAVCMSQTLLHPAAEKPTELEQIFLALAERGVIAKWDAQIGLLSGANEDWAFSPVALQEYVGVPTMNNVCKEIIAAPRIEKRFRTVVGRCIFGDDRWELFDRDGGSLGGYDLLISTDKLMGEAKSPNYTNFEGTDLTSFHSLVAESHSLAQFVMMLAFERPLGLPFDAAFSKVPLPALKSLCNESSKPGRDGELECWTVQSSTEYAASLLEQYPLRPPPTATESASDSSWRAESRAMAQDAAAAALWADFQMIVSSFGDVPEPTIRRAHRWGAAAPLNCPGNPRCLVEPAGRFIACGDYFVSAKLEGAALSGESAAQHALLLLGKGD